MQVLLLSLLVTFFRWGDNAFAISNRDLVGFLTAFRAENDQVTSIRDNFHEDNTSAATYSKTQNLWNQNQREIEIIKKIFFTSQKFL